jgi:glutathione peroxidase
MVSNITVMNLLQKLLKQSYPWRMQLSNITGIGRSLKTISTPITPPVSFYSLKAQTNNGNWFHFSELAGKNVLIVNTASHCGFTGQYDELEKLYGQYQGKLEILGFPANDFGSQEPGSDGQIAEFCRLNYGVSFPLFTKQSVKGAGQQPVFEWLSRPNQNGWNSAAPTWNFCKYLINSKGQLVGFFAPSVSPLAPEITKTLY